MKPMFDASISLWLRLQNHREFMHLNCKMTAIFQFLAAENLQPYSLARNVFDTQNQQLYNNTTTILRPFVQDYPGELVPEDILTHPPSWSSSNLYQLLPSTTIHSILLESTAVPGCKHIWQLFFCYNFSFQFHMLHVGYFIESLWLPPKHYIVSWRYGDTVEENSSLFSRIWMHQLPSARACRQ